MVQAFGNSPVRRAVSLGALATVLLSGCASIPKARDIALPRAAESFAASQSLTAPQVDWPSDRWWRDLGDPQLAQLIEEGLRGATDLRLAAARYDKARAAVGGARSQLLPQVNAQAQMGGTKQSYNYLFPDEAVPRGTQDFGQATLGFSWDLDFWGRNRATLAAAKSDARAAGAEAAAARLAVSTGIAAAYADLASLSADRDAVEKAVSIRTRTVSIIEHRGGQGLENQGATEQARSNLASAEADRAALDEQLTLTRNRIAALMGAGPDRGLSIARPTIRLTAAPGLPENVPAGLLGRRADVVAARYRTEAAASGIKRAKAGFYPNVNLIGLIGFQSLGIGNLLQSGSTFGTGGAAISLPIFQGGRLRAEYRGAEADYDAAVAQYDGTLTGALREVADAANSSKALATRLDRSKAAQTHAANAWRVANNRYQGGLATYLDVLTAEDKLITANRSVAALDARAFTLHVALVRALGGGFQA
jgi:NodT family efflux transporter outer membrane factor (OMF) lipoprotein